MRIEYLAILAIAIFVIYLTYSKDTTIETTIDSTTDRHLSRELPINTSFKDDRIENHDLTEDYVRLSDLYNRNPNNLYDDPYRRNYLSLNEYIPRSTLKETEESTRNFRHWYARPGQDGYRDHSTFPIPEYQLVGRGTVHSEDRFRPFYYNHNTSLRTYDDPWYSRPTPRRGRSYGPSTLWNDNVARHDSTDWVSSVNQYIPMKPLNTRWEKVGILSTTSTSDDTILNLYRRPIAPMQNLFEWSVQNIDGITVQISLNDPQDGDIIQSVPGMESKGSWSIKLYSKNQYVLV